MGSARQLASALGYTVGTFLLIPGSICFLAGTAKYQAGNDLYDIACSFLVLAGNGLRPFFLFYRNDSGCFRLFVLSLTLVSRLTVNF